MVSNYVNAAEALPSEMVESLRKVLGRGSVMLWVPAQKSINRRARDSYVVYLYQQGYSGAAIALQLFISERTVWRILARERALIAPSDPSQEEHQWSSVTVSHQSVGKHQGGDPNAIE
jgi:Homeodomain-like domain